MPMRSSVHCIFFIATTFLGIGCDSSNSNLPATPQTTYMAPALNKTVEATMARRQGDNYKDTCIYLNESFERRNTCSLSVQSDLSIRGVQVTDQEAEFRLLPAASTLERFSLEGTEVHGDIIQSDEVKAGDVWHMYKRNSDVGFEMVFEITEVVADSITVRYRVTVFNQLPLAL